MGWVRELLAGLSSLHARGVLHRDVKLANCSLCLAKVSPGATPTWRERADIVARLNRAWSPLKLMMDHTPRCMQTLQRGLDDRRHHPQVHHLSK